MPINYVLLENNLTSDPSDYMAAVQATRTAETDDIIARIIQQGSTVVKADILSVLEDYHTAIENMVLEGVNVNTPLANYSVSIKGVFNGPTDMFDPGRHQVVATTNPGKRFRRAVREHAQAVKGEALKPRPNPVEYTDVNSGERNSVLTPGGMGQLVGHRLKFDPAAAAQGIFFQAEGGAATKAAMVGRNKPGELMFMVPALAAGDYTLEVRTVMRGSEDVRTGALEATLTVA